MRILVLPLALALSANLAFAQAGSIGLFSDAVGADCNIDDTVSGLCSVYVVHVGAVGVTASSWAVTDPACLQATFLSSSTPFGILIGSSPFVPIGHSVGYGVCLSSPIHAGTLSYFCHGTTPPCCVQQVAPGQTGLVAVDCAATLVPVTGGAAIWNSNATCTCSVGIDASTWGHVKAMYQ